MIEMEEFRVNREAWKPFLKRWSEEWIAVHGAEPQSAAEEPAAEPRSAVEEPVTEPPSAVGEPAADGWLGFPPASAEQVEAAEARLGCALPPSFREFLLATDGWRWAGKFVDQLRGTGDIGWMRDVDPMWIEIYEEINEDADEDADEEDEEEDEEDTDEEDEEDEVAVLRRALLISLEADAGVLFLDPGDVDENGEWAAYELFSWRGAGPERHGSFYELMYDLYAGFHALDRPQCETQREWDTKIEQARLASLAGEVDGPLAVFEEAARFGRDRARILLFQMRAMLGFSDASQLVRSMLMRGGKLTWSLDAAFLTAEVLPVLLAEHESTAHWAAHSTLASLAEYGSEPVQRLVADYRARAGEPGFQARYGDPEFDAAVRAAIAGPADGDPWPLLRGALSTWRPLSDDHLAPIVLLADPRIAQLITPERGREILAMRRG
ncbi:SMI1/KNR4 family protein [Streptosporangium sp. NPDC000396]|uniref:SMI1/KNR4 family protein n=1 Tax=Streptosporangium sp. NPDC000396 TaxID=3366185 RepID=UPI0036B0152D